MVTKHSARRKSKGLFRLVIRLRKNGLSYSEIRNMTGLAKSTINNWLTYSGLVLSKDHFEIQARKRIENYKIATAASKEIRGQRKEKNINEFIEKVKEYFDNPLFIAGLMLYEAEGSKTGNEFSNSDYRVIKVFRLFLEQYFNIDEKYEYTYRLYIHTSRSTELNRIRNFWARKLNINSSLLKVTWKHNIVSKQQENKDYVGQLNLRISKRPYFTNKILALSTILLNKFQHSNCYK